jgi:hypothetical protein
VTYQLPVLYTVWPVDKPLPDDLEYEMDYEVFLPRSTANTTSAGVLAALESEALTLASGVQRVVQYYAWPIEGTITTYDNTLGYNVPMVNLNPVTYLISL